MHRRKFVVAALVLMTCMAAGAENLRLASLGSAPASYATRANPYAGWPEAIAAGRKLFLQHCAQCHGADASGGRAVPALRTQRVQSARAGALFWFLTNGNLRHGMPSWSRMPDERRWQIVTYLKSLQSGNAVPF